MRRTAAVLTAVLALPAAPAGSTVAAPVQLMRSYGGTARVHGADGGMWQIAVTVGHPGPVATPGESGRVEVSVYRCVTTKCGLVGVLPLAPSDARSAVRDNLDAAELDGVVDGVRLAVRLGGPGALGVISIDGVGARDRFFVGNENIAPPGTLYLGRLVCPMFDTRVRRGLHLVLPTTAPPRVDGLPPGLLTGARAARCATQS